MNVPSLIVAGERAPRAFADLAALAADLASLAGADIRFSPITASYPGHTGFPAIKCVDAGGMWFATAAIQGRSCEDLARAHADVLRAEAA